MRALLALPIASMLLAPLTATAAVAVDAFPAGTSSDGTVTADVDPVKPDALNADMKAKFAVKVTAPADCDGCAFQVGIGSRFVRVDTLGDNATFDSVVTLATPDKPGVYQAAVRVITPDGVKVEAPAGRLVVHGVVAWHVKASPADRSVAAGDRLTVKGTLKAEDVDGSMADSPFHSIVRLQLRKGDKWINVDSTNARRESVATLSAKIRKAADYRLFAVGEDTASESFRVTVRR